MSNRTLSKGEQERKKWEQNKLQETLAALLKEDDNRYCADCDAKGPRWVSWNLGVFLCIRCAGIHRNLGVHVSKVKSVNLDSWTPEQVQSMRVMGNCVARAVYESNLPDHFRRPQSDSAMEAFIRAKYDQKRYMMKDWGKPRVNVRDLPFWDEWESKKTSSGKPPGGRKDSGAPQRQAVAAPKPVAATSPTCNVSPPKPQAPETKKSAVDDLLSLAPAAPAAPTSSPAPAPEPLDDLLGLSMAEPVAPVTANSAPNVFPNNATPSPHPTNNSQLLMEAAVDTSAGAADRKSKTDILALYGSGQNMNASTPMFGPFATAPPPVYGAPSTAMPNPGYPSAGTAPAAFYGHPYSAYAAPTTPYAGYQMGPGMGFPQMGPQLPAMQQQFASMNFGVGAPAHPNTLATNLWQ